MRPDSHPLRSNGPTEEIKGIDEPVKLIYKWARGRKSIPLDGASWIEDYTDALRIVAARQGNSVQGTATDFTQLKEALTENFPAVRNRKDLELKLYSSYQSRGQEPTDFFYNLLKVHKRLGLKMSEEALVEHILARIEPQGPGLCEG
ncbi:uncharacterized protein TNCV_4565601 [Trichonephila clavipes]|nr:uncharacterized protein TNCV_4565601 [Trichonephila clavipes]